MDSFILVSSLDENISKLSRFLDFKFIYNQQY